MIELITTDALITELLSRFDHAIFAGMKVMSEHEDKDGDIFETRRHVGNTRVCQGLAFEIMCRTQAKWEDKVEPVEGDS